MQTCNGVKLATKKKMKDGNREWSIPSFAYYAGHKDGQLQTTTSYHAAVAMTQNPAEQLTAKLNASGIEATVSDLVADADTVIYDILVEIGEEASPPVAPTSLVDWHGRLRIVSIRVKNENQRGIIRRLCVATFAELPV